MEAKDISYSPNPARGCGHKKPGGFYAEGGTMSVGGALSAFVWVLGSSLAHGKNISTRIPPRQMKIGSAYGALLEGEFIDWVVPYEPHYKDTQRLANLKKRLPSYAIFDHVGSKHYTAFSFAEECTQYGPSRRITPDIAKMLLRGPEHEPGCMLPIPIFFTHSKIPLFANEKQRQEAIDLAQSILDGYDPAKKWHGATWDNPDWGMYSKFPNRGYDHYLIPILGIIDHLENNWLKIRNSPLWQDAKAFFDKLTYTEMVFGASWINQVSYVLPKGDEAVHPLVEQLPDLNILDLSADDTDGEGGENEDES
jgi:hypothetical protein